MKISCVIPVLNQFEISTQTIKYLVEAREQESDYEIVILDNGSDEPFKTDLPGVRVERWDEAIGSYKAFDWGFTVTDADIVAFFHSDFFVFEKGWDKQVLDCFEKKERLGMISFIGSDEIDWNGGRGSGTMSNWVERDVKWMDSGVEKNWHGSRAEDHGMRINEFRYAAVVDGCSMIIKRKAWDDVGFRQDFPPHHFYDRLISTQLLEKGWKIGVLDIESTHISGQTVAQEQKYIDFAKKWTRDNKITPGGIGTNWDSEVYREAERRWLGEYRDRKHFIPLKVNSYGDIIR